MDDEYERSLARRRSIAVPAATLCALGVPAGLVGGIWSDGRYAVTALVLLIPLVVAILWSINWKKW